MRDKPCLGKNILFVKSFGQQSKNKLGLSCAKLGGWVVNKAFSAKLELWLGLSLTKSVMQFIDIDAWPYSILF